MGQVKYFGCYDFDEEWYLVEMLLDIPSSGIKWSAIEVPEEGTGRDNWQVPYQEQYLNEDGTERVCDLYDEPEEDVQPCRVAFFICKGEGKVLSTPYGCFELVDGNAVPERLDGVVEFNADDDDEDE